MSIEGIENIINHVGVKGMKWGIRKKRTTKGESGAKGKTKTAKPTSTKKYKKGQARKLSDERLRKRVNRLNMERQYKDLITKQTPKSKVSRGANAVGKMLITSGTKAVRKQVAEPLMSHFVKKGVTAVQARRG